MEIRFDGVPAEFTALYCEYDLSPDFDCTQCFCALPELQSFIAIRQSRSLTGRTAQTNTVCRSLDLMLMGILPRLSIHSPETVPPTVYPFR